MITTDAMELAFKDDIAMMTIYGRLTEEDMGLCLDWLKAEIGTHGSFNLLMTMTKMKWPTAAAYKEEFSRLGDVFKMTKAIKKCAVVSDSRFVRTVSSIEGALIPRFEIKAFDGDEADAALAWLKT